MNLHPAFNTRPRLWGCVLLDVRQQHAQYRSKNRRGQSRLSNIDGWSGGGLDGVMARPLRYQAAVYHVMARGDGGKTAFDYDKDC